MSVAISPDGARAYVVSNYEWALSVLDLSSIGTFTEYFVLCTGFSSPQVQAICGEVEEKLYSEMKREPEHREGRRDGYSRFDEGGHP